MKTLRLLAMIFCLAQPSLCHSAEIAEMADPFQYDSTQPLDIQEIGVETKDGIRIHNMTYASPVAGRVPAYLVTPAGKGPFAGILFGHWGLGVRTEFLSDAVLYAKAGAVCLLIDYPWVRPTPWRRSHNNFEKPALEREVYEQAVIDLRRGIDLLRSRSDVDPARIAYVGHSYGAQWGAILSAIDKRMKTLVLIGGLGASRDVWLDSNEPGMVAFRETTTREKIDAYLKEIEKVDAIRFIPHSTPLPVLFQFGNYERYFDKSSMERYFQAAGDPKTAKWYDTGHEVSSLAAQIDRANWLRTHIGINPLPHIESLVHSK